ncbi:MAG: 4Fe-4S binding protein [Candidatus Omnitrophica bacterium]|nr:4Fe-4S binding protein [Candidatus Omnitrophota bacterium]
MFVPIISKPATSLANKTGSWRTKKRPNFLRRACIACNMCLYICPEGCIKGGQKNEFSPDLDFCKGCGLCAIICPKKDIEMVDEEER